MTPFKTAAAAALLFIPLTATAGGLPAPVATVDAVDVVETRFVVTMSDGSVRQGEDLVGAVLTMGLPDGTQAQIRIDGVETDPKDPEIVLYDFSARPAAGGDWQNLCNPDSYGVRKGFPMRGTLDEHVEYHPEAPGFSLTCVGGVQAKCVRWGYKPWLPDAADGVPMLDLYRTCMRMARADYCGEGQGTTRNGTMIDLYDVAGIQKRETDTTVPFEAAWNTHGAVCVRHTRIPQNITLEELARSCPRLAASLGDTCDEGAEGALMFNRSRTDL